MNGNIEAAFVGRVGTEPELKTSQAGKPWASLNVAVGSDHDVQWVRVAVFGETGERLAGHLHKGDKLYVEGTIKLNTWTDKEGQQRTGLSVAAWKAEKLGQIGRSKPTRPKAPPEGKHPPPPSAGGGSAVAAQRDWQRPSSPDDMIPF
jgi:single-strand DNA-binding protein